MDNGYPRSIINKQRVSLHMEIYRRMNINHDSLIKNAFVDHKNRNEKDVRRINLRLGRWISTVSK